MKRYARQMILPQVGVEGQRCLARSRVAIIGAGGLGTPAAIYLAAAGVGALEIVDGDSVSQSNLHRQFIYRHSDVGQPKATQLSFWLKEHYPDTQITTHSAFLTKDLAQSVFPKVDVVVDGTDNFASKYLINDSCTILNRPWVYGSLYQFEAQASVFSGSPCYRCLYPHPPLAPVENCSEAGILGATAGIVGSFQALEALKILLNHPELTPIRKKLQVFDFISYRHLLVDISARADCRCQQNLDWNQVIDPGLGHCHLPTEGALMIDVREDEERLAFSIPHAMAWPLSRLRNGQFPTLDSKLNYELVCATGRRARVALDLFKHQGAQNVCVKSGSIYESTL